MTLARDLIGRRPFLDVGIYGDSGTGKTRWGAVAPTPLILLSEAHGLATIHDANPEADVELIPSAVHLAKVVGLLSEGTETEVNGQPAWEWGDGRVCQTVVLDTLTDMQRHIVRYVSLGAQATDPRARIGELIYTEWRRIGEGVEQILTTLRALPFNVICICLAEHGEDDRARRRSTPVLMGKMGKTLAQYFSAFGYCAKQERENGVAYGIGWELASQYVTKPAPGFPRHTINTVKPGETSLGSLALATIGKHGLTVPHYSHDDAAYVLAHHLDQKGGPEQ